MKTRSLFFIISILNLGLLSAQNVLDQDDVYLVDSIGSNSICVHKNMSLINPLHYYRAIAQNIGMGIDTTSKYIELENVEFRVLVFPERTIPRIGMSGVAPNEHHIYLTKSRTLRRQHD